MTTARMSAGGDRYVGPLPYMAGALLSAVLAYFAFQTVLDVAAQSSCRTETTRTLNDDWTVTTVKQTVCD